VGVVAVGGYCGRKWSLERAWSLQIVFAADGSSTDLLSAAALRGACSLAQEVRTQKLPSPGLCGYRYDSDPSPSSYTEACCPDRSLGNIAARMGGKASCDLIDDADAASLKAHLEACAPLYHAGTLTLLSGETWAGAADYDTSFVDPSSCNYGNFAYDALNALLDREYLNPAYGRSLPPRYVKTMVPA